MDVAKSGWWILSARECMMFDHINIWSEETIFLVVAFFVALYLVAWLWDKSFEDIRTKPAQKRRKKKARVAL